ncbi:hypothetical protein EDF36_3414 [Rathayibacter sp. PhB152]|nr:MULTISPECIES: hypothetical protein [unclassified Rathayibacter]ROQ54942.1 hypothetical protein EDF36_3414 [Rathayibacter sp. PhB152]ROS29059.1 hypothetical protein EDF22_0794 [Rathayibacter sp. PhB127]TDX80526.1 hypothetical protein EDF35_0177 [Rathayibacter sp. PhB151]
MTRADLFEEIEPAVAPADGWRVADTGLKILVALGGIVLVAT